MKILVRIILFPFLLVFFILFLLITSIKFQVLDYTFVTNSFRTNDIYSKIPNLVISFIDQNMKNTNKNSDENNQESLNSTDQTQLLNSIKTNLTPALAEQVVDKNLFQIFGYINGTNESITFYIPASNLGIPTSVIKSDNIKMDTLGSDANNQIAVFKDASNKIALTWGITIVLLILILAANYLLGIKGFSVVLILLGLITLSFSLTLKYYVLAAFSSPSSSKEVSQQILSVISTSVFKDMIDLWVLICGIAFALGISLFVATRFMKPRVIPEIDSSNTISSTVQSTVKN